MLLVGRDGVVREDGLALVLALCEELLAEEVGGGLELVVAVAKVLKVVRHLHALQLLLEQVALVEEEDHRGVVEPLGVDNLRATAGKRGEMVGECVANRDRHRWDGVCQKGGARACSKRLMLSCIRFCDSSSKRT